MQSVTPIRSPQLTKVCEKPRRNIVLRHRPQPPRKKSGLPQAAVTPNKSTSQQPCSRFSVHDPMTVQAPDVPYALVVEDDFIICMDAMDILGQAGFQVLNAPHGDAAYDLLTIRHPEVVLLFTDVEMPGQLDGFALAHKVAALWPHISIVVASGNARPGPGSMPEKARFIAKPFSAELVHTHLQEILPYNQKPESLKAQS